MRDNFVDLRLTPVEKEQIGQLAKYYKTSLGGAVRIAVTLHAEALGAKAGRSEIPHVGYASARQGSGKGGQVADGFALRSNPNDHRRERLPLHVVNG